jgi:hypothetical protein
MRVETATEPGAEGRRNEDFVGTALPASGQGGVVVVLDGVTPRPGATGCRHDVPWFVARLGGALLELSVSRPELTLRGCLADAVERTSNVHRRTCELSHPNTPQSTVVAVRWDAERVEHLVLSDSVLLLADAADRVRAVVDDRLRRLPEPVPSLRALVRALPRGSAERQALWERYAAAVEALRNTEGGFFTAAADPSVADRAVCGTTPRAEVHALAALTDGAARLVDVFGETDWPGAVKLLRESGCAALLSRVRAAELADPHGERFPRGKRHDDATAAFARL